jgi:serine/threonine protein kinase
MIAQRTADVEPIPGYRLVAPLGRGGFGEVWRCEAPGGVPKAVKFVAGALDALDHNSGGAERELRALQHIKTLRHPFLLALDRVELIDDELVIVMELADRSLADLLQEHRAAGRMGVPRAELLRCLDEAAEVLDFLNLEHGLQHLDVKPHNLFLVGRHVKVADFGLVNSLAELHGGSPHAARLGAVTPLYAPPECFSGQVTLFSDQYSLAVTYCELLTGVRPFTATNFRQAALQHVSGDPDLSRLPAADRAAVARALSKEPRERFASCLDFIRALEAAPADASAPGSPAPETEPASLTATAALPEGGRNATPPADGSDPLAGMQFLECVGRTAVAETWKARTGDGRPRLVKFAFQCDPQGPGTARLRTRRHPGLVPLDAVCPDGGRLALVSDVGDASLASRLRECQANGLPGVPRAELLARLAEAAETLDDLQATQGLRHLGLTPRCLSLVGGRVRLLDFALVDLLWRPSGRALAALNPRYAAPELFDDRPASSSDAYSLAVIYTELLTGTHPLGRAAVRPSAASRSRGVPDLDLVPAADRAILTKALDPDPDRRFPSCTAFLLALEGCVVAPGSAAAILDLDPAAAAQAVERLVADASIGLKVCELHNTRYVLRPGRSIAHRCSARLAPGLVNLKLDGFRQHWGAAVEPATAGQFTYAVLAAGGAWSRWRRRRPGLRVSVAAPTPRGAMAEFAVEIVPWNCNPAQAARLLEEAGPPLLESLRSYLQPAPERRRSERLPLSRPVEVWAADGAAPPTVGEIWDVSAGGLGLWLPGPPPADDLLVRLTTPDGDGVLIPLHVVRARPRSDGRFDVGAAFMIDDPTASDPNV